MIALTPFQLQVAGIVVLVALGAGFVWWVVHIVMGMHRGKPLYVLPDPDAEEDGNETSMHVHRSGDGDTHVN